jgi:oxalate decarboxylase
MISSVHTFNLEAIKRKSVCDRGTRSIANADNFHILKGMALYSLHLDKGGVREPHWHPNAVELGYCLTGRAIMTIFSPGAGHDTFTVDAGEIAFVPRGCLHHIENIYEGETKFAIAFNHERPEDIGISGATGSMVDRVLGYTFGVNSQYFSKFKKKSPHDILITSKKSTTTSITTTPTYNKIPNRHKINLKRTPHLVQNKGGTASFATANN